MTSETGSTCGIRVSRRDTLPQFDLKLVDLTDRSVKWGG